MDLNREEIMVSKGSVLSRPRIFVAILAALALAGFLAFQVQSSGLAIAGHGGVTHVNACGTLSPAGEYELTSNIVGTGSCIIIGDNNITFSNPDGHTITGQNTTFHAGDYRLIDSIFEPRTVPLFWQCHLAP